MSTFELYPMANKVHELMVELAAHCAAPGTRKRLAHTAHSLIVGERARELH